MTDLDNAITCKLHGYANNAEYYDKTSCLHRLNEVKVPLLFFRACDDPVMDQHEDPGQFFKGNKNILLATTQHGGHGVYAENVLSFDQWWNKPAIDFL